MQRATSKRVEPPPLQRSGFKVPVLHTCTLPDSDVRDLLSRYNRRGTVDREFSRYLDAKATLQKHVATIELVDTECGLKIKIRLELPTTNKTIDRELHRTVTGMGFDLTLQIRSDDQKYLITERKEHNIARIVDMAEDLLRLVAILREPEYQAILSKLPPSYTPSEQEKPEPRSNIVPLFRTS
ncbi:hypothetical protein KKB44_02415 [Candidatus Micrarchaeota archaeon]|nr:hypothetical protein [Candidatus Micrarchaeota archaeon]